MKHLQPTGLSKLLKGINDEIEIVQQLDSVEAAVKYLLPPAV